MEKIFPYLAAFVAGTAFMLATSMTNEDARRDRDLYCEMVLLYEATDGEYGWPDYRDERSECDDSD